MRIVCPRCVAQYEVDESAIPEAGREVQCANCETIWFQDYIEMLPDRGGDTLIPKAPEQGVFDDLDGRDDVSFQSARATEQDPTASPEPSAKEEEVEHNVLEESVEDDTPLVEPDEDAEFEDDEPATDIPTKPIDADVLDVLRSEVAFSSARAKLDAATADALNGDGADIKHAVDAALGEADAHQNDPEAPAHEPPVAEDTPGELDLGDLTAFLDAHADETGSEPAADNTEPDANDLGTGGDDTEPASDYDPLADLDAIRNQLQNMAAQEEDVPQDADSQSPDYTPILPQDDPLPSDIVDSRAVTQLLHVDEAGRSRAERFHLSQDYQPVYDPADDADALTAAIASATQSSDPDVAPMDLDEEIELLDEDFEAERPRRAFRLDGGHPDADEIDDSLLDDPTDELTQTSEEPASVATSLLAGGLSRPRAKGGRARARNLPGFGLPQRDTDPSDSDGIEPMDRIADTDRKPKPDRKALLPDVEELDASLRNEGDQPHRRDQGLRDTHEEEVAAKPGRSFRRAFVWTVFLIALLLALYVLRPYLINAVPALSAVLDPYASAIDSARVMIESIVSG